jgi:hypothetical protein
MRRLLRWAASFIRGGGAKAGALKMQGKSVLADWKWITAFAAAGAVAAFGVSFGVPSRYVSSAVMRFSGDADSMGHLIALETELLSRSSLVELVSKPSLDLYKSERARIPLEDVVDRMRNRDIRVQPVHKEGNVTAIQISFAYRDQAKAQQVLRELVTRFVEKNVLKGRQRARMWEAAFQRTGPSVAKLELLDPPSLPERALAPNRALFAAAGIGGGLLIGLLALQTRRRPRHILAVTAWSLAGCAAAWGISFLIPERFVSTAVMRYTAPAAPKEIVAEAPGLASEDQMQRLGAEVLSPDSLERIFRNAGLDLHPSESSKSTLREVIGRMRNQDIAIRNMGVGAFGISFAYRDKYRAQAVVRELVRTFVERHLLEMRELEAGRSEDFRKMMEFRMGPTLEVLDPPSLPEAPVSPNRAVFAIGGLMVGLVAGAFSTRRRKEPPAATAPAAMPAPTGP